MDFHPRPGKGGGAWCTSFRDSWYQNGKKVTPIVSIVCNFTRPTGDTPALLSLDEVTTLFHESGHALHGLFTDGPYRRTAGNVPRDFVELPSQFMENWATEPEVLRAYAKHYKTGEVMPDALIEKYQKVRSSIRASSPENTLQLLCWIWICIASHLPATYLPSKKLRWITSV